jgi:hypothetical protein
VCSTLPLSCWSRRRNKSRSMASTRSPRRPDKSSDVTSRLRWTRNLGDGHATRDDDTSSEDRCLPLPLVSWPAGSSASATKRAPNASPSRRYTCRGRAVAPLRGCPLLPLLQPVRSALGRHRGTALPRDIAHVSLSGCPSTSTDPFRGSLHFTSSGLLPKATATAWRAAKLIR